MSREEYCFFFFNDTATTEIYTLSLHRRSSDLRPPRVLALERDPRQHPIEPRRELPRAVAQQRHHGGRDHHPHDQDVDQDRDRKSTRLNSSHANISYAVFCL